jgi:hypothetical protein
VSAASSRRADTPQLPDALALSDAFRERPQPVGEAGAVSLAGSNVDGAVGQLWT